VRDRAVQQLADEHPAHLDVRYERGLALRQFDRVDLRLRRADIAVLRGRNHQRGQRHAGLRGHRRAGLRLHDLTGSHGQPVAGGGRHLPRLVGQGQFGRRDAAWNGRRLLLPAQDRGGAQDGRHRLGVAGAAAQHARQRVAHFRLGRVGILLQERLGREQLCRGAVAALDRARLDERLLQRVQPGGVLPALFWMLAQGLHRRDVMPAGLRGQQRAGGHRKAVEPHGACTALARLTAVLDAEHAVAPQRIQQRFVRGHLPGLRLVVQGKFEQHHDLPACDSARRASTTAISRRYSLEPRKSPAG